MAEKGRGGGRGGKENNTKVCWRRGEERGGQTEGGKESPSAPLGRVAVQACTR